MAGVAMPRVFTIVLNWNRPADTIECVESLEKVVYPDHEILIVDNGSIDGSAEILKGRFPGIKLIENHRNLGFAGGCNVGIRRALSGGADLVVLLNNDTTVDPYFVTAMAEAVEQGVGMLCSRVYFYDRPDTIWYAGASFYPWLGWGRHRGFGSKDDGRFDAPGETQRPCACSMMVTRRLCGEVGLLDEEYFCYCEDMDWGMRAKRAGFRVVYVPGSKVWHKASSSTRGSLLPVYYNVRNMLRCLDANSPLFFPLRQMRWLAVVLAGVMGLFTMGAPIPAGLKRIFEGVRDYLAGRFGEFKG